MSATQAITREDELIAARTAESIRAREANFKRAQTHSIRVRVLKWSLPVLGVGIAAAFGIYTFLSRVPELSYDIASIAYSDGKLVMSNPKLNGLTSDNLPYSLTAARATQDPATQNVFELEGIRANVPLDAATSAEITADRGVYDSQISILTVNSLMTVKATNGMTAKLNSAAIDVNKGTLTTGDPVEVTQDENRLTADSMQILENGKLLVFETRVRLNIVPTPAGQKTQMGAQNAGN